MTGYRTQLAALLVALTGAAQQFGWGIDIPKDWTGALMMGLGVVFFLLRKTTTGPSKI